MSNSDRIAEESRFYWRICFVVGVASFVVILAGIRAAQGIVVPFLVALFIAIISLPPLAWMQRKAALADGTRVGLPLLPADVLDAAIMEFSGELKAIDQCRRPRRGGAPELLLVARAGLLSDIAGLTIREVASRLGRCEATVYRWGRSHRELVVGNAEYAAVAAASVHSGLQELG